MMLHVTPIPAFTDNYIWALQIPDQSGIYVVDPGDAEPVFNFLKSTGSSLAGILITHHHGDHTGGILALADLYDCPVFGPTNSAIKGITRPLKHGDVVELGSIELRVMAIPGHTLDHIAYVTSGVSPQLFCGDTLFAAGCGRLFEGTPQQMWASLQSLASLPSDTTVYCAHEYTLSNLRFAHHVEPDNQAIKARIERSERLRAESLPTLPSTLTDELDTNPFLRLAVPALQQTIDDHAGKPVEDEAERFAVLRRWKDNF